MPIPLRIRGCTRTPGQPADWDESSGHVAGLPIRDDTVEGIPFMISAHELTPAELQGLNEGKPLVIGISGYQHPVIFIRVGDFE